jgi:hypothetical protein
MAYSALYSIVFEALNLLLIILYTYFAEIQLHAMSFGSSPEHRVLSKLLPWLASGDFHHILRSTNALCQQLVLTVT